MGNKLIAGILLIALPLSGCASMRRHPLAYGMATGAVIGVTVGLLTRQSCPHTINGVSYNGTPPCPKYCDPKEGDCYWPK